MLSTDQERTGEPRIGDMANDQRRLVCWGGHGPVVHVAHANGFPPGTYRRVIDHLRSVCRVVSWTTLPLRKGTDPLRVAGWDELAEDLGEGLRGAGLEGIIGVGHSLGGVISAMAGAPDPNLFRALVLVDPVLFTGWLSRAWWLTKALGQGHRFHLVRKARRRRERFPSRTVIVRAWRGRGIFAGWDEGVLEDYVAAGFANDGDEVRLVYPKTWEARIFELTPHNPWPFIRRLTVPVVALRGETSDAFSRAAAARLERESVNGTCLEVPGTSHFLPMERPDRVAELILDVVNRESVSPSRS